MLINNKNLIKTIKRVDLTNEQETNLNEIPNIKNDLNNIKNTELQNLNTSIQTLETLVGVDETGLPSGDSNIIASINRIDSKPSGTNVDLSEYQKKSDNNLTTTDKNIVGAINEIKTSLSNLVIESGKLDIIDYTFGCTLKLDEINPIYGNIIVNKTSITGNERDSDSFTVKLDSAPNTTQTVDVACSHAYIYLSPQKLTFTPSNYNIEQTVTISLLEDPTYTNWETSITVSSLGVNTQIINVSVTNTTEEPVAITGISLNKSSLTLNEGAN